MDRYEKLLAAAIRSSMSILRSSALLSEILMAAPVAASKIVLPYLVY